MAKELEAAQAEVKSPVLDHQLTEINEWARTNMHKPDVAKWIEAWREWERVEDTCTIRQYRSFCSNHGIKRKKDAEESFTRESNVLKKSLRQSLILWATGLLAEQHPKQTQLHAYFARACDMQAVTVEMQGCSVDGVL